MPRQWTIAQVRAFDEGDEPVWLIDYQPVGDGEAFTYVIAKAAIEFRAAEYGLDDIDEVLTAVLHEPLLRRMHSEGVGVIEPVAMLDAASARERIRAQVATCRRRYGEVATAVAAAGVRSVAADPLKVIRDATRLDPVRLAVIRLEIDRAMLAGRPS